MEYWQDKIEIHNSKKRKCAEFLLTPEEMAKKIIDLIEYYDRKVEEMAKQGLCEGGIYKLIPPLGWKMPGKKIQLLDEICGLSGSSGARREYLEKRTGSSTIFRKNMEYEFPRSYTIRQFYEMARKEGVGPITDQLDADEAIKEFESSKRFEYITKEIKRTKFPSFYISDLEANLFHGPDTSTKWTPATPASFKTSNTGAGLNINDGEYDGLRATISPYASNVSRLVGINCCTLLIGCPLSSFAHHWEDGSLSSINYLHCGSPKIWIGVSPKNAWKIYHALYKERAALNCEDRLRHKDLFLTTSWLDQLGINYDVIVQREGEFVVTRPKAVHGGLNCSFNLAEATNFVSDEWVRLSNMPRELMPICCSEKALALSRKEMNGIEEAHEKIKEGAKIVQADAAARMAKRRAEMSVEEKTANNAKEAAARKIKRAEKMAKMSEEEIKAEKEKRNAADRARRLKKQMERIEEAGSSNTISN